MAKAVQLWQRRRMSLGAQEDWSMVRTRVDSASMVALVSRLSWLRRAVSVVVVVIPAPASAMVRRRAGNGASWPAWGRLPPV